jgi:hypothetical protein
VFAPTFLPKITDGALALSLPKSNRFFFIVGGKNLTGNAQEGTAAGIKRPMQAEPNSGLKNSECKTICHKALYMSNLMAMAISPDLRRFTLCMSCANIQAKYK